MAEATTFRLFAGLDGAVVRDFLAAHPVRHAQAGERLVREGEANDALYLIESGSVGIWRAEDDARHRLHLATLGPGDSFGEMSALKGEAASATLVAETPTTLRRFTLADLPTADGLRERVALNLARTVVDRLSSTNDAVLSRHMERIETMQVQLSISVFLTKTLVGLALYIFLLPLVQVVKPWLPSDSLISFFFIITYLVISVLIVRQSALAPREYGVTLEGWPRAVGRALMLTLPVMVLVLAMKYALMLAHPGQYELFEPWRAMATPEGRKPEGDLSLLWLGLTVTYLILSFAQEFIRCAIQGSLAIFYRVTGVSDAWKSILVANVVFAALHTHLSNVFALIVFIPGLFWGWLYHREHSFIGVAVSHGLLGTWAVFVVGVPY